MGRRLFGRTMHDRSQEGQRWPTIDLMANLDDPRGLVERSASDGKGPEVDVSLGSEVDSQSPMWFEPEHDQPFLHIFDWLCDGMQVQLDVGAIRTSVDATR